MTMTELVSRQEVFLCCSGLQVPSGVSAFLLEEIESFAGTVRTSTLASAGSIRGFLQQVQSSWHDSLAAQ